MGVNAKWAMPPVRSEVVLEVPVCGCASCLDTQDAKETVDVERAAAAWFWMPKMWTWNSKILNAPCGGITGERPLSSRIVP